MLTAWSNRMQVLNPWKWFLLYLSLPTPPLQGWVDSSGLSSRECPKFLLTMFGPGQGHHIFLLKNRCPYFRLPWLCHLSKHHSTLSFCWRTSHRRSIKKWRCCIITKLKLEYWNWNVIWLSGVIKYDPSWDFFFQSFTNDQTFGSPSAIEKQEPDWTGMASQCFVTSGPRDVRVIHARQSSVGREFVPLPFQPWWLPSSLLTDGAVWPVAEENETNSKKNYLVEEPSSNRAREIRSCRLCLKVSSVYSFRVPMPLLHPLLAKLGFGSLWFSSDTLI